MASPRLFDPNRLVAFRHDLHKHAELSFNEFRTKAKILEYLSQLGIKDSQIREVVKTGLIVDILGTAPPSGKPFCIALRADMDGLPIKENNPDIDYQSVNEGASHMCGHDMHVTCLIGGAALVLEKLDQIPSDKKLRLLFQPAEETDGGALPMIKEGAMEGVDEVYGMHNWPLDKPGKLFVKKGYMMALLSEVHIVIHGKGGHSSLKDKLKDPLQPAVDIQVGLRGIIQGFKDKGELFTICLPYLKTGDAPNAIADKCEMRGYLRSFGDEFTKNFCDSLRTLIEDTCKQYECTADIKIEENFPALFNTDKETDHVLRVGKKVFGEENVSDNDERLPVYGGEDFSYFNRERPGTFFFLSSARAHDDVLHTDRFNPNDDMLEKACEMWLRLVEDRFEQSLN